MNSCPDQEEILELFQMSDRRRSKVTGPSPSQEAKWEAQGRTLRACRFLSRLKTGIAFNKISSSLTHANTRLLRFQPRFFQ